MPRLRVYESDRMSRIPESGPDKRELRCGPWNKDKSGITVCRKCGRPDPLDFIDCGPRVYDPDRDDDNIDMSAEGATAQAMNPGHADNPWTPTAARLREALAEVERLQEQLADLDEQNMMQQDYLRQIRDAAAIEYARGLAQEAIERSR